MAVWDAVRVKAAEAQATRDDAWGRPAS
jgi:hypothetical protein